MIFSISGGTIVIKVNLARKRKSGDQRHSHIGSQADIWLLIDIKISLVVVDLDIVYLTTI